MAPPVHPNTLNVLHLSIAFFFVFSAFNSQGFIQESVLNSLAKKGVIDMHDGYVSLSLIYACFTLSNFVAPLVVGVLEARRALVFSGATYALFQLGFLFVNKAYLYLSSILLGFGAAVIWTAQGNYIALNSNAGTSKRHSGLFWAISQACLISGGLFLFVIFALFGNEPGFGDAQVRWLYGTFTFVTCVGVALFATLRMPPYGGGYNQNERSPSTASDASTDERFGDSSHRELVGEGAGAPPDPAPAGVIVAEEFTIQSILLRLRKSLDLLRTGPMPSMAVVFAHTGVVVSFWSSIYPTSIIATKHLAENTKTLMALNAIALGLGQAIAGYIFGFVGAKLERKFVCTIGAGVHLAAFLAIFVNFPADAPIGHDDYPTLLGSPSAFLALLCGFALGFGDACWNTQIFSFLLENYPEQSSEAFAIFKFFQSLLASVMFLLSRFLLLYWHVGVLSVGSLLSCAIVFVVEKRNAEAVFDGSA